MSKLKDEVMKCSKAEQFEIYEAIESKLFGENQTSLSKEQIKFVNKRLTMIDSDAATYISPEKLRQEPDKIAG